MAAEWFLRSWVFALALIIDACLLRVRKAQEFEHHDPEIFALYAASAVA